MEWDYLEEWVSGGSGRHRESGPDSLWEVGDVLLEEVQPVSAPPG